MASQLDGVYGFDLQFDGKGYLGVADLMNTCCTELHKSSGSYCSIPALAEDRRHLRGKGAHHGQQLCSLKTAEAF